MSRPTTRILLLCATAGVLGAGTLALARPPAPPPPVLRESVAVRVGTADERWRLEWRSPPREACAPQAEDVVSCPCTGFAYGEMGVLDLVRRRPGHPDERLPLTPLFHDPDNADWDSPSEDLAARQRWPVRESDVNETDQAAFERRVRARPSVRVMALRDYDHDGRATEFLLQVGTAPCGRRESIVVGVSRGRPALHAFTSVAHPERPLVLEATIWERLARSGGGVSVLEWPCGDHGAETRTDVRIAVTPGGIDGTRSESECGRNGAAGRRVSSERI